MNPTFAIDFRYVTHGQLAKDGALPSSILHIILIQYILSSKLKSMTDSNIGMGACCLSGAIHSGKPRGRDEEIGGLSTYVVEPTGGSKARTVVFLVDSTCIPNSLAKFEAQHLTIGTIVFGWKLNNIRLLADQYADAGFFVYIPDLHQGDSLAESFLQTVEPPLPEREAQSTVEKAAATAKVGATLGPWLIKHRESVSEPLLAGFINTIKLTPGTNKIGTIGFCWVRYIDGPVP